MSLRVVDESLGIGDVCVEQLLLVAFQFDESPSLTGAEATCLRGVGNEVRVPASCRWGKDVRFGSYAGTRNWRAMAGWSMGWSLSDPWKVTYDTSVEKWCYSRPFNFYMKDKKVKTRYVVVVMGRTARRIITAYPTEGKNSCKGNVMVRNWINP